jgi:hypothetical protein
MDSKNRRLESPFRKHFLIGSMLILSPPLQIAGDNNSHIGRYNHMVARFLVLDQEYFDLRDSAALKEIFFWHFLNIVDQNRLGGF